MLAGLETEQLLCHMNEENFVEVAFDMVIYAKNSLK